MEPEDARLVYLGVDVAGARNTWVAAISPGAGGREVVHSPRKATLQELVDYCEKHNVAAATIDAQLTMALSDEKGFRTSDIKLKSMLQKVNRDYRDWVASINSLMAVPVRGRLLADHLSPTVGTLLETHPRASLLFGLNHVEEDISTAIQHYKMKSNDTKAQVREREPHTRQLWRLWSERFRIAPHEPLAYHDGALDSLVCATVAYLFHHEPDTLLRLRHDAPEKTGRGPFYVINPETGE